LAFCAATGFVSAATLSSFYKLVTSEAANFSVDRKTWPGLLIAIAVNMFAGPFIVAERLIAGLRRRELAAIPAVLGAIVAGMWSVCAGVFYLSLLVAA
jgi:hypothetical protein